MPVRVTGPSVLNLIAPQTPMNPASLCLQGSASYPPVPRNHRSGECFAYLSLIALSSHPEKSLPGCQNCCWLLTALHRSNAECCCSELNKAAVQGQHPKNWAAGTFPALLPSSAYPGLGSQERSCLSWAAAACCCLCWAPTLPDLEGCKSEDWWVMTFLRFFFSISTLVLVHLALVCSLSHWDFFVLWWKVL